MGRRRMKLWKARIALLVVIALAVIVPWVIMSTYQETMKTLKEKLAAEVKELPTKKQMPRAGHYRSESQAWKLLTKDEEELYKDAEELTHILEQKLAAFPNEPLKDVPDRICGEVQNKVYESWPCFEKDCQSFSPSPETRIRQLLARRDLTAVESVLSIMRESAKAVEPHKYVIATSSSSNHFYELQALVYNIHNYMLPQITNYTLVIYDLGLDEEQLKLTKKNCKCTVLQFPMSRLPRFVHDLHCFAWKPLVIRTLIEKAEILLYHDTSIRWFYHTNATRVFTDAKERGMQLAIDPSGPIGHRTAKKMLDYFGDQACQYVPHGELQGGIGVYHNEKFVVDFVMGVWVTCALSEKCMCVHSERMHRHDQSALGIIVSKLYVNHTSVVTAYGPQLEIKRGDTMRWFQR